MLKKHMLSCKDVAHIASDYLDKNTTGKVSWKIRLHLLICRSCQLFVKHLKISQEVVPKIIKNNRQEIDAENILQRIKDQND